MIENKLFFWISFLVRFLKPGAQITYSVMVRLFLSMFTSKKENDKQPTTYIQLKEMVFGFLFGTESKEKHLKDALYLKKKTILIEVTLYTRARTLSYIDYFNKILQQYKWFARCKHQVFVEAYNCLPL